MSRVYVNDDIGSEWAVICWRGAVKKAIEGKRGQAFLRELRQALLDLPEKKLIEGAFEKDGEYCAIGTVAKKRGMDLDELNTLYRNPETGYKHDVDPEIVGKKFGIAMTLAWEIMYENDERYWRNRSGAERYEHMLEWVNEHIKEPEAAK